MKFTDTENMLFLFIEFLRLLEILRPPSEAKFSFCLLKYWVKYTVHPTHLRVGRKDKTQQNYTKITSNTSLRDLVVISSAITQLI